MPVDDATFDFAGVLSPELEVAGWLARAGGGLFARVRCGSFVAGTLVGMRQGLRPIEEIAVGDLVLAWDCVYRFREFTARGGSFADDAASVYRIRIGFRYEF